MYYVYAIVSKNKNRIYVGLTKDLGSRLKEHNRGKTKSTQCYRPWTLLYFEKFPARTVARMREKQLKSGYGKEFLKEVRQDKAIY